MDRGELVRNWRGGSLIICYSFSWNTKVFNLECIAWGWVGCWNGWAKKRIFMRDSNFFERYLFLERQQDWVRREMFASSNRIYICLIIPIYNLSCSFSTAAYWFGENFYIETYQKFKSTWDWFKQLNNNNETSTSVANTKPTVLSPLSYLYSFLFLPTRGNTNHEFYLYYFLAFLCSFATYLCVCI